MKRAKTTQSDSSSGAKLMKWLGKTPEPVAVAVSTAKVVKKFKKEGEGKVTTAAAAEDEQPPPPPEKKKYVPAPYVVPHAKATIFRAHLPEVNVRITMKSWNQGGPEWKRWRSTNATVGASSYAEMIGLGAYGTPYSFMGLLCGRFKKDRPESTFTLIGHLMEEICVELTVRHFKRLFAVKDMTTSEIGVLFNTEYPWGTASIDRLLNGGTFQTEQGTTISLDDCIMECKVPSRSRHDHAPEQYLVQIMWQLHTARSQGDQSLRRKQYGILAILEPPFTRFNEEEGMEAFEVDTTAPWVLKTWLVPYHPPLIAYMQERTALFIEFYERMVKDPCNLDHELKPGQEFIKESYGKLPKYAHPRPQKLFETQFTYVGQRAAALRDEDHREAFYNDAHFGRANGGRISHWKQTS